MKVMIPGGTGLIGQALTQFLADRGHQVWVLTRRPEERQFPDRIKSIGWDAKTVQDWAQWLPEMDAIINLTGANIGERPWTHERKRLLRDSRVDAGKALVEALQQSSPRPPLLIQIAGVGYYGVQKDEALDEQAPAGNDYLARVAADWEQSTAPVTELGVRQVVLRTGVVLTQKGGVLKPFLLQNQLFAGGPLGSGRQWISWVHLQDLLRMMLFFLEQKKPIEQVGQDVYNGVAPQPVTNAEFGRTVSRILHRPFWAPVPAILLRAVMGEMSTLVLDGQRVLPRRLVEQGFVFDFPTLELALADLLDPEKH